MTSASQLVCRRCGFHNVPGDQFCGSCGAFLEWEGEPTEDAPPPAAPGDPDVPSVAPAGGPAADVAASEAPTVAWGTPVPPPATPAVAPVQRAAATASGPAAGLIRCPACGIANAASRTFCQSCGTKLAEAPKVAEVSAAQIAAAVAASGRPAATPTSPVRSTQSEPAESSSGGFRKWIVVMAVTGVLIGAGVVGANVLLRGEGPASEATMGPTVRASAAAASAAPSVEAPSEAAPASDEPSAPPATAPTPVALELTGATASSVVGDLAKFQPGKAIDGDPKTAWQEGAKVEKGQWIEVTFAPSKVTSLFINNGYNASTDLYRGNRRLKDITVSVNGGAPVKARLKDTGKTQKVSLKDVRGATSVRITIVSTYPSKKTSVSGTPFDDAALGEIVVNGVAQGLD